MCFVYRRPPLPPSFPHFDFLSSFVCFHTQARIFTGCLLFFFTSLLCERLVDVAAATWLHAVRESHTHTHAWDKNTEQPLMLSCARHSLWGSHPSLLKLCVPGNDDLLPQVSNTCTRAGSSAVVNVGLHVLRVGSQFTFLEKTGVNLVFPLTMLSPSSTAHFLPLEKVPIKCFVMFVFAQRSINYASAASTGDEGLLCSPSGCKLIHGISH